MIIYMTRVWLFLLGCEKMNSGLTVDVLQEIGRSVSHITMNTADTTNILSLDLAAKRDLPEREFEVVK